MDRLDRITALVRQHVPDLRLVDRNRVPWMQLAGRLASPLMPDLNLRYTTVIGSTVYLPCPPEDFPREPLAATLAHELVHQLDQRRWGPLFYLSYVGAAPSVRTVRAVWERRAYAVDLLVARERGGEAAVRDTLLRLVELFSGGAYGFMWAGRAAAAAFLEPVAREVLDGSIDEREPYAAILAAWREP